MKPFQLRDNTRCRAPQYSVMSVCRHVPVRCSASSDEVDGGAQPDYSIGLFHSSLGDVYFGGEVATTPHPKHDDDDDSKTRKKKGRYQVARLPLTKVPCEHAVNMNG